MTKIKHWYLTTARNLCFLAGNRFYFIQSILQSAYIIPASYSHPDLFYINNYIDWDQYNTLYSSDFLKGKS